MEYYRNFYHEIRIPRNDFFSIEKNKNEEESVVVITSPSRMGNHLLMSILDGHPSLPRIPGEDGFLSFSFFRANVDVKKFVKNLKNKSVYYATHLPANLGFNKWYLYSNLNESNSDDKHSGINIDNYPAVKDYKNVNPKIDYKEYEKLIKEKFLNNEKKDRYNYFLSAYMDALRRTDYDWNKYGEKYDKIIAFSGMRAQSKWMCKTHSDVKIIRSLRSLSTYAVSHVKSRYKKEVSVNDKKEEIWGHWYHKVVDSVYLKEKYPEKVVLVKYDDLVESPQKEVEGICSELGIEYHESLEVPTVLSVPVSGNPSRKNVGGRGEIYSAGPKADTSIFPEDHEFLWKYIDELTASW